MLDKELLSEDVFKYFSEICDIPHPSYHEKQISDYLVDFAKQHNLEWYRDDLCNVIIIAPATDDMQDAEPVILQGHMDMVCEKDADCKKDMQTEGLDIYNEGDFITARGTTLGADDGIAVAMALAILAGDMPHPRIEFVCTVSEEVGMEGASFIDVSLLTAKRMINIDTEEEGHFLAGCAGGGTIEITLNFDDHLAKDCCEKSEISKYHIGRVSVTNLVGGHSGIEINKGRANANVLMGRIIKDMHDLMNDARDFGFFIKGVEGGSKDNAIPREATLEFLFNEKYTDALTAMLGGLQKLFRMEYAGIDDAVKVTFDDLGSASEQEIVNGILVPSQVKQLSKLINQLPNGVIAMSSEVEGMVETSLNLGVFEYADGRASFRFCVRSEKLVEYKKLTGKLQQITDEFAGIMERSGEYPPWEYQVDCSFRDLAAGVYEEMFGKAPIIETVHAGVECGILADKIKSLEAICIGPDIYGIHTPEEKLSIESTRRTFEFVKKLLTVR